ncbi:MAG TPA: ATP-binding protein [Elusimicrobiota bacterium]|nr:ATP-binding protein [Elusimicrobiota bacterium]
MESLNARERVQSRVVESLPFGLAVLRLEDPGNGESWIVEELNRAGLRLMAAGSGPAGRRLLELAPGLRGGAVPGACAEALGRDRVVELPDVSGFPGTPGRRFSIRIFPLGAPLVGLAFEDVTARRAADEALQRSNAELAQFAFVAAHDLQSPLRKTKAFVEQLKLRLGDGLDETSRDFMERIARSMEAMQSLVNAVLALAQAGSRPLAPADADLAALAAETLGDLRGEIDRAGARVEVAALPVVRADPREIRQLLRNLIGNALKFAAPGRAPRVRLRGRARDDGRVELVVEDDGVGFDMAFAERAFQPFQRLHSRKDYPGSGMGLAICRRIVERFGGTISVETAVGRGARFTVVFPAREAP